MHNETPRTSPRISVHHLQQGHILHEHVLYVYKPTTIRLQHSSAAFWSVDFCITGVLIMQYKLENMILSEVAIKYYTSGEYNMLRLCLRVGKGMPPLKQVKLHPLDNTPHCLYLQILVLHQWFLSGKLAQLNLRII